MATKVEWRYAVLCVDGQTGLLLECIACDLYTDYVASVSVSQHNVLFIIQYPMDERRITLFGQVERVRIW